MTAALLAALLSGLTACLLVPAGAPLIADGSRRPRPEPGRGSRLPALAAVASGSAVALLAGGTLGVVLGVAAGVVVLGLVHRLEPAAARRRREALAADLPHAVDLLAACLTAGQSPGAAIDQVAAVVDEPLRGELQEISARLRLGVDPVTVWRDLARHPELGVWGRCLLRASDSGASVADAMARLADDLRASTRAATEARARALGVRAALPLGICLLPAFVLLGVVPLVAGSLSMLSLP